jgi:hypothetical protein
LQQIGKIRNYKREKRCGYVIFAPQFGQNFVPA